MVHIALASGRTITAADVVRLNQAIGWLTETSAEDYAIALDAGPAVGAWESESARLLGLARAINDGATHAYIDDVMVHPERRGRAIAVRMLNELYDSLASVRTTTFSSGEGLAPPYEAVGFDRARQVVMHSQNPAVARRRGAALSASSGSRRTGQSRWGSSACALWGFTKMTIHAPVSLGTVRQGARTGSRMHCRHR